MGKHRKPEKSGKPGQNDHGQEKSKLAAQGKASSRLLVEVRPDWHAIALPNISIPNEISPVHAHLLERVQTHASSLLDAETEHYASTQLQSSSSHKFYSTIMTSGTWGDKVSALTLLVQESPVHTTKYLENLLGMAGKKTRSQALIALGAVKDMVAQGALIPSERKLRMFKKQPALLAAFQDVEPSWTAKDPLPGSLTKTHLVIWAFEDWLKRKYFEVLRILEAWCGDEVEFSRIRAVQFVWELLKEKPEQEENLLRLLVNKLGDNSKKVASKASHLLLQLQNTHPSMKSIIINSINTEILLRSGQTAHTKYYAVITLNQTVLSTSDPELADKLLEVYFSLFVTILNKSRSLSKHSGTSSTKDKPETNEKKRKRTQPNPVSAEELASEQQLEDKIIAQVLTGINRAFPYSKGDGATFEKHLDTMFRITHSANFNTSVQALMLIQQISASHHLTADRFLRTLYESLLDPRLLKSSKQTMYLNLLYRSLKSDGSVRRVKAFVKRLLQILSLHEPPFVTAALYLVAELCSIFPSLKTMFDTPETTEDDEDEIFRDVVEDPTTSPGPAATTIPHTTSSNSYDPRKRDPLHARADAAPAWELPPYLAHYHPSITLFASSLLLSQPTPPNPDPTAHTLMHFLDRFVYRNPKAPKSTSDAIPTRGSSLMQPALASTNTTDTLFRAAPSASLPNDPASAIPLNSAAFWERRAADVAPEDVFFHAYFGAVGPKRRAAMERRASARQASTTTSSSKQPRDDIENDDEVDDEWDDRVGAGEDEIWKALVGSAPELAEDEEDDDGGSGFDSEDDKALRREMDDEITSASDSNDESGDEGVELNLSSDDDEDDEEEDEEEGLATPLSISSASSSASFENMEMQVELSPRKTEKDEEDEKKERKKQRKAKKALPMFADVGEYEKMLADESDGVGED